MVVNKTFWHSFILMKWKNNLWISPNFFIDCLSSVYIAVQYCTLPITVRRLYGHINVIFVTKYSWFLLSIIRYNLNVRLQLLHCNMNFMKLVIPLHWLYCLLACFLRENGFFFSCNLGKSPQFCMVFCRKWNFFVCSPHVGGMFLGKILKNVIENYASRDLVIQLYSIPNCD